MQSCGRALERRMGFSVLTRRTCLYHGGLRDALNFRSASLHGGGGAIGGSAKRTSRVGGAVRTAPWHGARSLVRHDR